MRPALNAAGKQKIFYILRTKEKKNDKTNVTKFFKLMNLDKEYMVIIFFKFAIFLMRYSEKGQNGRGMGNRGLLFCYLKCMCISLNFLKSEK